MTTVRDQRTKARHLIAAAGLTLAALPLAVGGAGAQEVEQAGVSAAVSGEVLLARTSAVGRQVESGEAIFLGDSIENGPNGNLQVLLMDESVLTLGPDSRIEIDRFIYDPATDQGNMALTLAQGTMRFVAGKVAGGDPEDMRINTPVGHIGIRGTIGLVQVLTAGQAQQQFPSQVPPQGGGNPNQPVVFAALAGPGPQSSGTPTGSFSFSTPNGSVDLNRPGGAVLATPGQPPVFFIAPPGALNNLSQQLTGGRTGNASGPDNQGPQSQQQPTQQGDGVTSNDVQSSGGSSQPVPTFVTASQVEQTAGQGDQGSSAADANDIASSNATSGNSASTVSTLQELVAANSGSVSGESIAFTGSITGSLEYFISFSDKTFDFKATALNGPGLTNDSIVVSNNGATLPQDSRTSLTIGNSGQDFSATTSTGCTSCSLEVQFPTTSTFNATVRNESSSGTTGNQDLSQ